MEALGAVYFKTKQTCLALQRLPDVRFWAPRARIHAWLLLCLGGQQANRPLLEPCQHGQAVLLPLVITRAMLTWQQHKVVHMFHV